VQANQELIREEHMSAGIITVIIVVAAIVVVAVVAGVVYDARRRHLRRRFGPEYDSLVEERGSRRKAEAELAGRERRVRGLDIRPLDPAARSRYARRWTAVQEHFVDAPPGAVEDAQRLVLAVMSERGYPTEGDDQVLADLSVDHAGALDHYRAAHGISQRAADNLASTEDLRQAVIHYRALFQDLLGRPGDPGPEPGVSGQVLAVHERVPSEAEVAAAEGAGTEGAGTEGAGAEVAAAEVPGPPGR
jgi:hypothetical protein